MILGLSLPQPACWRLLAEASPFVRLDGAEARLKAGDYLALHATCVMDLEQLAALQKLGVQVPTDLPHDQVVAIGQVLSSQPQGVMLGYLRALPPIPHPGGEGLWEPDPALLQLLRLAWKTSEPPALPPTQRPDFPWNDQ